MLLKIYKVKYIKYKSTVQNDIKIKQLYSTQTKTTSSINYSTIMSHILFRHFRLLFETACLLSGDSPHGQLKVTRLWSLDLQCQRVADSWSIKLILGILTMQPFLRKHYSIPQDPVSDQNIFMSGPGLTLSFATRFIFAQFSWDL